MNFLKQFRKKQCHHYTNFSENRVGGTLPSSTDKDEHYPDANAETKILQGYYRSTSLVHLSDTKIFDKY